MSHEISQFTAGRMHSNKRQYPFTASTRALYYTFAAEEGMLAIRLISRSLYFTCSSYIHTLDAEHNPITCCADNGIKRKLESFPEKSSVFEANMCHTVCGGVKYHIGEDTIFAVGAKYFIAEMELMHFGDEGYFIHLLALVLMGL